MNMPSQFLVNRVKNALNLSLSGAARSLKECIPFRKSRANSRLSCADLTNSTPLRGQNIDSGAPALLVLLSNLNGEVNQRRNDTDGSDHLPNRGKHFPVHEDGVCLTRHKLRGTQVAAPGSTLAMLDIQENDAV